VAPVASSAAPPVIAVAATMPDLPPPLPSTTVPTPVGSAAPPPAPTPSAAPQVTLPPYDLSSARVVIGSPTNVVGATSGGIAHGVGDAAGQLTNCYRRELPKLTGTIEGRGKVHLETDGAGVITDARTSGPGDSAMTSCIASALRGRRIPNVDTGNASADLPLEFKAR
jgi:hypothetical protein